jgi:hypothetical protein
LVFVVSLQLKSIEKRASNEPGDAARAVPAIPLWLWPNILSLDAPMVAVLWQFVFDKSFGVPIDSVALAVLGMCAWLVYASDRILDGLHDAPPPDETPRHRFYRVHCAWILPWMAAVSAITLWLSLARLQTVLFQSYSILALAVLVYLVIVHLSPRIVKTIFPKEMMVALLFACGVCTPALIEPTASSLIFAALLMFSAVLWINAAGIEHWETKRRPMARSRLNLKGTCNSAAYLRVASVTITVAAALLAFCSAGSERVLYEAIAVTALALGALDCSRDWLSRDLLRVLADVALLSPLLFLPLLLK